MGVENGIILTLETRNKKPKPFLVVADIHTGEMVKYKAS